MANLEVNLDGWDASLSEYFNRYLGITADISGACGSPEFLGVLALGRIQNNDSRDNQ